MFGRYGHCMEASVSASPFSQPTLFLPVPNMLEGVLGWLNWMEWLIPLRMLWLLEDLWCFFEKKKRKEKYAAVQSNRIFLLRWSFAVTPSPFGNLPFKTGGLQKRSERLGGFLLQLHSLTISPKIFVVFVLITIVLCFSPLDPFEGRGCQAVFRCCVWHFQVLLSAALLTSHKGSLLSKVLLAFIWYLKVFDHWSLIIDLVSLLLCLTFPSRTQCRTLGVCSSRVL